MTAADHSIVDAASLRLRRVRTCLGDGNWSEPRVVTDIRGTPVGDKARVWEWDRLVWPGRARAGRRVREHVKVMHCPEGWYSDSDTPDESGPALCTTLLDPRWAGTAGGIDHTRFRAHHDEHPVVWVIKVKRHSRVSVFRYCDPELPDDYRPAPELPATTAT